MGLFKYLNHSFFKSILLAFSNPSKKALALRTEILTILHQFFYYKKSFLLFTFENYFVQENQLDSFAALLKFKKSVELVLENQKSLEQSLPQIQRCLDELLFLFFEDDTFQQIYQFYSRSQNQFE